MSSQTTDTPGTTTSTSQPWIAPEQLLKLTGSFTPKQIRVSGFPSEENRSQPLQERSKALPELVLIFGGLAAVVTSSSLSPSRRLRKQYTCSRATANPPARRVRSPTFRGSTGHWHPGRGLRRRTFVLCAAAQSWGRRGSPGRGAGLTQKSRQP